MEEKLVFISYSSADKAVADAICHRLEERGIRCWIAPRDIGISDWAAAIMDGLRRSEVFVVIISHNSIESPEVAKEVTEATRTCRYLLPFKVDEEELSDRLRYHLGPCHWLDAVLPPLEKRIDELAERILHLSEEDAVYGNHSRLRLIDRPKLPRGLFVGRENEIEEISAKMQDHHILFLQGMGGIGKSEIAKSYAQKYRARYDTVIFASYSSDLLSLVCSDELPIENLRRADSEGQEEWFRRKLDAFRALAGDRTLLIIDNFDVDEDEHLEDLLDLPCQLLFTTRNDHSDYPTLRIGRISDFEQLRKIFSTHYGRPLKENEQEAVDEILQLVNGHTITVELIAKQMRASFLKPAQMLDRLKQTGVNLHLKEKVKREGSAEKLSAFDYIRQLFHFSDLTEEENHLLACLYLVPYSGIAVPVLGEILELEDYDAVNSLINKSWLMLDEEEDTISLHPVIGDVVKEVLKPTPVSCQDFVHGFWKIACRFWNMDLEERDPLYPIIVRILEYYPEPAPELIAEYIRFVDDCWICHDYERSQRFGRIVYDCAVKTFGEASEEAGNAAMTLAAAYYNAGEEMAAQPWYQKALNHLTGALGAEAHPVSITYTKLARGALAKGDYAESHALFDKAFAIMEHSKEKGIIHPKSGYPPYYGALVMEHGRLLQAEGRYEEALEQARSCHKIFMDSGEDGLANQHYSLMDQGVCLSMMGRYEEAAEYLRQALDLDLQLQGPESIITGMAREAVGDNLNRMGDRNAARRTYSELELDFEKLYGEKNSFVKKIREKREALTPHDDTGQITD